MDLGKTKAELIAEIENLKHQLEDKKKEEQYDDTATELHNMYASYVKAGFTEEQSWELTKIIINNGTKLKH